MPRPLPTTRSNDDPRHVGVVMDGNGRWAAQRGLPRAIGHQRGVEAVRRLVQAAGDAGLPFVTVYGFSTENWSRPPEEIDGLFGLLRQYFQSDLPRLRDEGVRVRVIGRRDDLDLELRALITEAEDSTQNNHALNLTIAFNYGARDELARAARRIAEGVVAGRFAADLVDEDLVAASLDTASIPDPDLIIRTSGECRLSNFLLWQAAYAELVFVDAYWPDFRAEHLYDAMAEYRRRQRRFGGVATEQAV